jgi:hypothetical protein
MKTLIGNKYKNKNSNSTVASTRSASRKVNPLLASIVEVDNQSFTENGAPTLKSTLNAVLDLFAMGGSLRSRQDSEVISLFTKAFSEDALLTLKCVFNIRNARGGNGERKTFKTILRYLGDNYPDILAKNLTNIVKFGRWDDLYVLFGTRSEKAMLDFVYAQLEEDVANYEADNSISLLAKWMPSINTSSAKTVALANLFRSHFSWGQKQYRKTLATLRSYSNVVETFLCENKWNEINYSAIPSQASLKYSKAFRKHDTTRYDAFVADVKSGKAKINASVLFPYEIVEKVHADYSNTNQTLDVLWDSLPNYLGDSNRNILCVCDVSASMNGRPMQVSISLGIYTAERNNGPFKDYFITYSGEPKLQKVVGNNIREKVANLQKHVAYNTNLQAVFDMLLTHARANDVKQSDMPAQVMVISDMEFDHPQHHGGNYMGQGGTATNFEVIKDKYAKAGYEVPQLVFWNVRSAQNNVPSSANEKGVLLVSGSSPSVFKTLLSGKQYTPVDQMLETLNQDIYNSITI